MISLYEALPNLARWQVRYLSYVLVGDGCWGWTGHHTHDGYSRFSFSPGDGMGRDAYAHVIMYRMLVGEVPPGMQLDHICRNRGCVNHDHLQITTQQENLGRRDVMCKKGHPMREENRKRNACGRSCCLTCYNDRLARDKAARLARGHKKPGRKPKIARF